MIPRPVLLLIGIACIAAVPAGASPSSLKIGCWNLQNFLVGNRFENGSFLYKYPMPEPRKQRIRELIRIHDPDILFLQEMGSKAFLLELQRDLMAGGLHFPFFHFSGFPDARSGLAFLSKIAPGEVIFHDLSLRRGVQEVRMPIGDACIRLFHVHLKSRYSDDSNDPQSTRVRRQEIGMLADALEEFRKADLRSRFILLGDFNTPLDDPLLQPLYQSWWPLHIADKENNPDTYFHHSGTAEVLDAFWIPDNSTLHASGSLHPLPPDCPSDHRFLLVNMPLSD